LLLAQAGGYVTFLNTDGNPFSASEPTLEPEPDPATQYEPPTYEPLLPGTPYG